MLDDLGLIHMNGRIFDPHLAKFLSADPFVKDPSDARSLDRYAYSMHSPLEDSDPTGYIFDSLFRGVNKILGDFAPIVAIGVWFIPGVGQFAAAGLLQAASVGFITGGIATGTLKGAALGAFSAGAGAAVGAAGNLTGANLMTARGLTQLAAYGAVGGALSVMQGGKFGHGFVTAGLTRAVTASIPNVETSATIGGVDMGNVASSAVVGGVISDVTGGKFANGAVAGGFQALFSQIKASASVSQVGGATEGAGSEANRASFKKALNDLRDAGKLSERKSFKTADEAATAVLEVTAPLSAQYGLEVGGNIWEDGKGWHYTFPHIGGPGSVDIAISHIGYHTHPSGSLIFSNKFQKYKAGNGDAGWVERSRKALYLGVKIRNSVSIGTCDPGACSLVGFLGTKPSRVLQ